MTISAYNSKGFTSRYGNPTLDCSGAQIRAHSRHVATVVTITGSIGADNGDRLAARAQRLLFADKPIVVDLSGVTSFAAEAVSILIGFGEQCQKAGVEWALVVSEAVAEQLRIQHVDAAPVVDSVAEALHELDDAILDRRRMLLPLLRKSA
jgi:anti-anti-sigma regulatory factor